MPKQSTAGRTVWILTLCTALALLGDATMYAVLPALYADVGITAAQVGVLLSINRLVRPPLNMLGGWISRRLGPHWPFMAGLTIGFCSTLGYGLVEGFVPLLILRALWGVAWALLVVAAYSMVLDVTDEAIRGRYSGIYYTFSFFGGALGAMGGGFMADAVGFARTMQILGGVSATAILFVFFLPRRAAADEPPLASDPARGLRTRLRLMADGLRGLDARLWLILGLNFAHRLFFAGVFYGTLGFYLGRVLPDGLRLGGTLVGVASLTAALIFARNLITVVSGPLLGYVSDRLRDRTLVLLLGEICGVAGLLCFAVGGSLAVLLLGVLLTALGYGIVPPMLVSWMGDLTRKGRRGEIVGGYQTMGDLGSGLGPLAAYPLMLWLGPQPVYLLSAVLLALAVPLVWRARRRDTMSR
jgi:MFS family permease